MLVHREKQVAQLRWAYRACEQQGHGHVALVTGAVGSGKTRVLDAFGEWSVDNGGRLLTAAGSRAEHGLHFGVLGQLLHSARLSEEETSRLDDLMHEAAQRLPAVETAGDAADLLPTDGPVWAPLLHGVFTTLNGLAARGPLVVTVDDLHHADAASLRCLLYVTRRLRHARIMILLSEASTPAPAHPLFHAELLSQPRFTRVTLPPMSVECIAQLLDRDTERAGNREEATRLLHATGGNPLLAQALVDERADREPDTVPAAGARVGDAFHQAVLRCLYRHEPGVRRVAQALAVLDRPATAELLGQLLDVLPDSTVPALRVLQSSGLIDADHVRHPRIRHAILSDMPPEQRRGLHQRAAEVLHEHGAEAGVVAEHLVASAWTGAPWVVPVLKEAAAQALASGRPDLAAGCLRLGARSENDAQRRASLMAMLVNARWQVNPLAVGGYLGELTQAAHDDGRTPSASVATVPYLLWQGRVEEAAEAVTGHTAADRGPAASRLQVMQLLVALSHPDYLATVRETPSSWSRAATVPHSVSPSLQAVSVLGNALIPAGGNDTVGAAEQLLQRHHIDHGALGLLTAPLLALLCSGRAERVAVWGEVLLDLPAARYSPTWRAIVLAILAEAALRLGDLSTAEQRARAALEELPAPAWGVAVGGPLGTLITCATESGRLFEADRWLAQPVPPGVFRTPMGAHYLAARGRHHLAMGRHQAASADLHRCGELMRDWGIDVAGLVPWRLELARVQLSLGNRTHAAQLLQEQLQVPHGLDDRTRGRALRLLASTAGPDHRRKLLSKAVSLLQSCSDRQELARALTDTSQALQQAGDSAQARLFVRRASQVAQEPGVAPPAPPRLTRREPGQVASTAQVAGREREDVLSDAERRVAVLAARGHTNRQISNELFITVSTVEQHLTRVYRKLDVKRRTDLPSRLRAFDEPTAEGARGEAC